MTDDDLKELSDLLRKFERVDFGDLANFNLGNWSRRNLEGIREDIRVLRRKRAQEEPRYV